MAEFPFRPGFEPLEGVRDTYHYPDGPDVLLRQYQLPEITPAQEAVARHIALLAELPRFGIDVVPARPVITGPHEFAMVVDRIDGKSFREHMFDTMNPEQNRAARELVGKTMNYLEYKVETGEEMLGDVFGAHQYMFEDGQPPKFVDVEVMGTMARGVGPRRAECEINNVVFSLSSGYELTEEGDPDREQWTRHAQVIIDKIRHAHQLTITPEQEAVILASARNHDYESVDAPYAEIANAPANAAFLARERALSAQMRARYEETHPEE